MRKKRGYTREIAEDLVRDYKLFAIACEGGKREPEYFRLFEQISNKIKVDIIEDKISDSELKHKYETKSAPNWVLDRAVKYIEKEGLIAEDDLWFIIDKDKWSFEQLNNIASYCKEKPNWHIVISNPCFEVWLYFHKKKEIPNSQKVKCKALKTDLVKLEKGGYNQYKFIPNLFEAIENAKNKDFDENYFMPNNGETKVYQLGEALIEKIGRDDFEEFLKKKVKIFQNIHYPKIGKKVRTKKRK